MAIAFDSVGTGANTTTSGSTLSWTHTINANNQGMLIASLSGLGTSQITSLKFAGQSLTKIIGAKSSSTLASELWYLSSPPTGLGTFNGTWGLANGNRRTGVSMAYTGVAQANPFSGSTSGTTSSGTSGSITATLNSNAWFVGGFSLKNSPGTIVVGNNRGTAGAASAEEQIGVDLTSGTLQMTNATGTTVMLGAFMNAYSGAGTNLIQSAGTANLGLGSTSVSWGQNTTTGNLVVVGVGLVHVTDVSVSSITDSQGNFYKKGRSGGNGVGGTETVKGELWYSANIIGGAGSVTVNHDASNAAVYVREYSGFNAYDQDTQKTGSASALNSGTTNTLGFGTSLMIVATTDDSGVGQTYAAEGSFEDMVGTTTTLTGVAMEDLITTSTNALTGTLNFGAAANYNAISSVFYYDPIFMQGTVGTISDSHPVHGTMTFSNMLNRVLVVAAGAHQDTVGTVSLNGTMLTEIITGTTQFNEEANLWFYNNPPAGAAGTITVDDTGGNGLSFVAAEFSNVQQFNVPAGSTSGTQNNNNPLGTLATGANNYKLIGAFYSEGAYQGDNPNYQKNIGNFQAQSFENFAASSLFVPTVGSGTMSWSLSSGQRWADVMLSLIPFTGINPPSSSSLGWKSLLGVGD